MDICLIAETHLVLGNNEDLSELEPHYVYCKERSVVEKKGGGKIMIVRKGVNHIRWELGLVMFPYLSAERAWILTHENNSNSRWLRRAATKTQCLKSRLRQLNWEKVVKGFTNEKVGQI